MPLLVPKGWVKGDAIQVIGKSGQRRAVARSGPPPDMLGRQAIPNEIGSIEFNNDVELLIWIAWWFDINPR